ncbi:hypothetical protein STEG23_010948 [Scotinomys teguina]
MSGNVGTDLCKQISLGDVLKLVRKREKVVKAGVVENSHVNAILLMADADHAEDAAECVANPILLSPPCKPVM